MAAKKPERAVNPMHTEDRYAAARALYEGTPGMTLKKAAEEAGLGKSNVERRANTEGWKKNFKDGQMTAAAQAAADMFKSRMDDFGPEATAEQREVATQELIEKVSIDLRGEMLDRHRREWAAPRAMSAEAVRLRDVDAEKSFTRAKLAKITAETLKIVQDGERKAWGLDVGELPAGSVVVIERA